MAVLRCDASISVDISIATTNGIEFVRASIGDELAGSNGVLCAARKTWELAIEIPRADSGLDTAAVLAYFVFGVEGIATPATATTQQQEHEECRAFESRNFHRSFLRLSSSVIEQADDKAFGPMGAKDEDLLYISRPRRSRNDRPKTPRRVLADLS